MFAENRCGIEPGKPCNLRVCGLVYLATKERSISHEGGEFQKWYEKLVATKLVSHPDVQGYRRRPRQSHHGAFAKTVAYDCSPINSRNDALDHLPTGSGYTWIAVLKPFGTASTKKKFGQHWLKNVNAILQPEERRQL